MDTHIRSYIDDDCCITIEDPFAPADATEDRLDAEFARVEAEYAAATTQAVAQAA